MIGWRMFSWTLHHLCITCLVNQLSGTSRQWTQHMVETPLLSIVNALPLGQMSNYAVRNVVWFHLWVWHQANCTHPMASTDSLRYGSTIIALAMLQSPSAAMMPTPVRPTLSSVFRSTLATKTCSQRNSAKTGHHLNYWESNCTSTRGTRLNVGGCFSPFIYSLS